MIGATINGVHVAVAEGTTILDAARQAQVEIPVLCKHPDLPPTAGCGICVVQVAGNARFVRSCCTPVEEGMQIITQNAELARARSTVVELILSNHPNECLTCARNGTCELQTVASRFGIRKATYPNIVRDLPVDDSTGAIVLEPRKCIKCGRCITVCQQMQNVWALSFLERSRETRMAPAGDIRLGESPCIRCGQCSAHCPTGAIFELDQTDEVWSMLRDRTLHCVAQVAPAVRVSIGEAFGYEPGTNLTRKLYAALRRMGFSAVFDTNFGADVTVMEEASEFVRRFRDGAGVLPLVTSCCPSWVDFMEKFHDDMIGGFSTCKSPHAILGALAKTYYADRIQVPAERLRVVSIMPCTSKKYEIQRSAQMFASGQQDVDLSITTRELGRMIRQAGIDFASLPNEDADDPLGRYSGAGTIFGATGGVTQAVLRTAHYLLTGRNLSELEFEPVQGLDGVKEASVEIDGRTVRMAVAHGMANVESVLGTIRAARAGAEQPPFHLVEVMACPGGCVGGGGQSWGVTDAVRKRRAQGLQGDDRACAARRAHDNPSVTQLYEQFLGAPLGERSRALLHTRYESRPTYKR